ncbi:MAG: hypothetical protein ACP5O6_07270 [Candidatus Baltobacteraceae bacterium]
MIERSAIALYAVAGGIAFAFYLGPYRSGTARIASDASVIRRNESAIAEDRRLLREASALRTLQDRVRRAIRSPLQADNAGTGQAMFFERLYATARKEKVTLTTILQGAERSTKAEGSLASMPMKVTAVGKLSGVLRFLSAIDAGVGLVDFGEVEIHPEAMRGEDAGAVAVRIDGTFLKIRQPGGRMNR